MTDTATFQSLSTSPVREAVARAWLPVLVRGAAAVIFAVVTFATPGISLMALIWLYGAYATIDGVAALTAALRAGQEEGRWWSALAGAASVVAGLLAFILPGLTAVTLVVLIGAWAIIHGAAEIAGAIHLRKVIDHAEILLVAGSISVFFGMTLIAVPAAGALALLWLMGLWAALFGGLMIYWALRLRALTH